MQELQTTGRALGALDPKLSEIRLRYDCGWSDCVIRR